MKALTRTGVGCSPVDPQRALIIWERFDTDKNGTVSYEEFVHSWGRKKPEKAAIFAPTAEVPKRSEAEWEELIKAEDLAAFGTLEPGSDASAEASVNRGVTIGFLIDFTNKHACWEYPTWKVVRDIIQPATAATRMRYADLPEVRALGVVGRASTFGSHCWGARWGVLVSALADHSVRDRRVWLDVFAVRQWQGNTADLAFAGVIDRCSSFVIACERADTEEKENQGRTFVGMTIEQTFAKRVDLLAEEVRSKIAFFRSWCLLEIQTAVNAPNCAVVMRIGEPDNDKLSADGCPRFRPDNGMPKALTNLVDIAQAEAKMPEDRDRILNGVKAQKGGVQELNDVVRGVIITSMACGDAPEVLAAAMGDEGVLNIEHGTPAQIQTWACAAAAGGYDELLIKLLDAGAGPATLDKGMLSPLTSAAQAGQESSLKIILERVADPNQPLNLEGCGYRGSLKGPTTPGDVLEAVNFKDSDGDSALLLAALNGKDKTIAVLLDAGADIHTYNSCKTTAIKQAADNGHLSTIKLLVEKGADVNFGDCDDDSPLIGAAESGHLEACKLLVQYGARLDHTNHSGDTAADKAESNGCGEVAVWLREQMAAKGGAE